MNCTQQQLDEEIKDFIHDCQALAGIMFWPERAIWLNDFEGHPSESQGIRQTKPLIEIALRSAHEYALEATWDEAKGAIDEFMMFMDTIKALPSLPHFNASTGNEYPGLMETAENALARWALDDGRELELKQVALLADMAEGSIRNATYAHGEDRLEVMPTKLHGPEGRYVSNAEALRWLARKRNFKPTQIYNSLYGTAGHLEHIGSAEELTKMLFRRSEALGIDRADLFDALELNADDTQVLSTQWWSIEAREVVLRQLASVERCMRVAELLQLNPAWFIQRCGELILEEHRKGVLEARAKEMERLLNKPTKQTASVEPLFDDAWPSSADRIRMLLQHRKDFRPHPKFKPGNKKMEGYLASNGSALTFEHNLKTPPIWVQAKDLPQDLADIEHSFYPAEELWKGGIYGRHSGLRNYPELADADLIKFVPRTLGEVCKVLDYVSVRAPS